MAILICWHGVACLFDEWGPLGEYRDALKTVRGLEEILQSGRLMHKVETVDQQQQRLPGHYGAYLEMQLRSRWHQELVHVQGSCKKRGRCSSIRHVSL